MFLAPFKLFDLVAFPIEPQAVYHIFTIYVPVANVVPDDLAISTAPEHPTEASPCMQNGAKRKFMTYENLDYYNSIDD